jgi:glycosyltransferase involved in cell wall biosynthesis
MAGEYLRADVFAFPSRYEGFGISLAEAMQAGLPFVAFASGGVVEVARGSGGLVADGDVPALRAALEKLISDPAHRAREAARSRARASELPSWEDAGRCFARALDEAVSSA